jgi:hypothetical protein
LIAEAFSDVVEAKQRGEEREDQSWAAVGAAGTNTQYGSLLEIKVFE